MLCLALAAPLLAAPVSRAGVWVQVSCVNPDGSAAPSQGWSGSASGAPELGSVADPRCTPQVPMEAILFEADPAPDGAGETLQYAPPTGSSVIGGTLDVGLYADGYGTGSDEYDWGTAGVLEPGPEQTSANDVELCTQSQDLCQNGTDDYTGTLSLPVAAGGDVYLEANCNGFNASGGCNAGGSHDAWALAELSAADIVLQNDAQPAASGFTGRILRPRASGDASLAFTATDSNGPGVYLVTAAIDDHVVYDATPNTEDGGCESVGTSSSPSAWMFDDAQPCPQEEPVSLSLPTGGLRDGRHRLTVTVTDAAGNATQVLSRRISTRNSGATRTRLPRLRVRLTFRWRWNGDRTHLRAALVADPPRGAHATMSCRGDGCPRLRRGSLRLGRLLRVVRGRVFAAGDRILLVIRTPGRAAERVSITIRDGRVPDVRLLGGR